MLLFLNTILLALLAAAPDAREPGDELTELVAALGDPDEAEATEDRLLLEIRRRRGAWPELGALVDAGLAEPGAVGKAHLARLWAHLRVERHRAEGDTYLWMRVLADRAGSTTLKLHDAIVADVRAQLRSPDDIRRVMAVSILGSSGRPGVVGELVDRWRDDERLVRDAVLPSLLRLGPAALPELRARLERVGRRSELEARMLTAALGCGASEPALLDRLAWHLRSETWLPQPGWALQALGDLGTRRSTALLLELVAEDPGRYADAFLYLNEAKGPELPSKIAALAGHPHARVRANAMRSLLRRGDPIDEELALRLVRDPESEPREAALEVVARRGIEAGLPHLAGALVGGDPRRKGEVAKLVLEMEDEGHRRAVAARLAGHRPSWVAGLRPSPPESRVFLGDPPFDLPLDSPWLHVDLERREATVDASAMGLRTGPHLVWTLTVFPRADLPFLARLDGARTLGALAGSLGVDGADLGLVLLEYQAARQVGWDLPEAERAAGLDFDVEPGAPPAMPHRPLVQHAWVGER